MCMLTYMPTTFTTALSHLISIPASKSMLLSLDSLFGAVKAVMRHVDSNQQILLVGFRLAY